MSNLSLKRGLCTSPAFWRKTLEFVKSKMKAKRIEGRLIADQIQDELREEIAEWVEKGNRKPSLHTITVGSDPASQKYIEKKLLAAKYVGIEATSINLPANTTQSKLLADIRNMNANEAIDAILVQLPLPDDFSETDVCNAIDPSKDVDGFNVYNAGRLFLNMDTVVPCTALAVLELLRRSQIETFGKHVVVCGRSKHVGLPISLLLHSDKKYDLPGYEATTTICHRNTPPGDLKTLASHADILISATGIPKLVTKDMVKPGSCVIDVGLTRVTREDGTEALVGDVDSEVEDVAGHLTPVPGGVGPMTVAMLMSNTFKLAKSHKK